MHKTLWLSMALAALPLATAPAFAQAEAARSETIKRIAPNASVNTYILLDRTGSMQDIWDEALTSVNAYAEALAEGDGALRTLVTLAVFDAQNGLQFDVLRKKVPATGWRQVTTAEASPRGMTPLYDAIGRIVSIAEQDNPKKAVLVIMTDGEENSSREITQAGARAALDRARAKGWEVVFLGAEFAKFTDAGSMGVATEKTMAVGKDGMTSTMQRLAKKSRDYGSSNASAPVTFNAEDRAVAKEDEVKNRKK
jgi:hypothetical protein